MQKPANVRTGLWVSAAVLCCVACQNDEPAAPAPQTGAGGASTPAADGGGPAGGSRTLASAAGRLAVPSSGAAAGASAPVTAAAGSGSATAGSAAPNTAAGASSPAMPSAAEGGAAPTGAAVNCELPGEYTRANRLALELKWPSTIAIEGGTGSLIAWTKAKYVRQADGTTRIESHPCGTITPTVTATALAGGLKSEFQVPIGAFESPSMPAYEGTLTQASSMLILDPGPNLIGATLSDPNGAWPLPADLMAIDHDGDGSPGVTALPTEGEGYLKPPSSVSQTEFIDRVFIASRIRLKVMITRTDCSPMLQAAIEPVGFDYTIVGCHVKDRDDCTASETRFLSNQGPRFMLGKIGTWTEVEVPASASCADVRAALPPA
jgi:hypothetical protein